MSIIIETATSKLITHEIGNSKLLERCVNEVDLFLDEYPEIFIHGRKCFQKRCVGFFSNTSSGYKYSGQNANSKPLTPSLEILLNLTNRFFESEYNGILINKYKDGEDYIGAHSDDEINLDRNSGVVILSYGATRIFRIRDKITNEKIIDLETESNIAIQMLGNFQKEFKHEIPKQKRIKDVRYSFTFRCHST